MKKITATKALRNAIKAAEKRGVKQSQIAAIAGMPRSQLSRIAKGESIPRLDTAERIAAAVGCRIVVAN